MHLYQLYPAIKLLDFPWSLVHRSVNAQVDVLTYHDFYTPRNEVEGGGILVSLCPLVCSSVCPSVEQIGSALYLPQY